MKRLFLFAFLFSLLILTTGCPPPHPPVPPTGPVCGNHVCEPGESVASCPVDCAPAPVCNNNGVCDPGETEANCPADCKPATVCGNGICEEGETAANCPKDCSTPVPSAVCGDGVCDPTENSTTCPQDCPPSARHKDHTVERLFGAYVGFTVQPSFNFYKMAAALYASHYTGASFHLISPWSNYDTLTSPGGFYPWPFDIKTHKFDLASGKMNEAFFAHLNDLFTAFAQYDLTVEICFGDIYFETQWHTEKYGSAYHPFRNNNIGVNLGNSALPFYDSWDRRGVADSNFFWLSWAKENPKKPWDVSMYKITSKFGTAYQNYISRSAQTAGKVKKLYPNFRLRWRSFNEQYCRIDSTGHTDYSKHMGGYNEIEFWINSFFEANGFKRGTPYYRVVDDWLPWTSLSPLTVDYKVMSSSAASLARIGIDYEIHGNVDSSTVKGYTTHGVNSKTTIFSSDGDKEDASYPTRMKSIDKLGVPFADFKLADWLGLYVSKDMNLTFARLFPVNAAGIFGDKVKIQNVEIQTESVPYDPIPEFSIFSESVQKMLSNPVQDLDVPQTLPTEPDAGVLPAGPLPVTQVFMGDPTLLDHSTVILNANAAMLAAKFDYGVLVTSSRKQLVIVIFYRPKPAGHPGEHLTITTDPTQFMFGQAFTNLGDKFVVDVGGKLYYLGEKW